MVTKQNHQDPTYTAELAVNHMDHVCKQLGVAMEDMIAIAYYKIFGMKKK